MCLNLVFKKMGRKAGLCGARIKKTLSALQRQITGAEWNGEFSDNLRCHSDVFSSGTESGVDEAAEHTETCFVAALDSSGGRSIQVSYLSLIYCNVLI